MKKTAIKITAVAICCIMVVQAIVMGGFSFVSDAASNGIGVLYENKFSSDFNSLKNSGVWDVETDQRRDATAPDMNGSAMVMNTKDSVQFKWTEVDGVGAYDSTKTYVFEFDAKVTNTGSGTLFDGPDHTRILYVAFGGWYNQIEINNKDGKLRAGDTYSAYDDSVFKNKTVHVKLSLSGNTATSIITDASGKEILSGSRTNSGYSNMTYVADKYYKDDYRTHTPAMKTVVLRCEDGGVEIDNFKFSVERYEEIGSTELDIPQGKQAVYECNINYVKGTTNTVRLGANEILSIGDDGIRVCGCKTSGTYNPGKYGVKAYVNPTQKMMYVEVTLPEGGLLRRGTSAMLSDSTKISVFSTSPANLSGAKVSYESISVNDYQFVQVEPGESGFGAYLYNLVTSFDDATSTRNFAWTVSEVFLGDETFALKYREKGTTAWSKVDATKRAEKTNVPSEDYYEASIKGLKADTEYEYKIGIKDSTDETNDWTKTYTFTTASNNINEFSFIAVGDTQGQSWDGDSTSTKGYKYAMVAIEEAMQEVPGAAFILNAGDVTDSGNALNHWNWYFKSLGKYGPSIPHFATQGNHDAWGGESVDNNNYFSLHFNHPDNGANALDTAIAGSVTHPQAVRLVNHYSDTIYSYNYGEAHFIVLNSGPYVADDFYILNAQREWLENDLKANKDAKWTIILVHEAVYHRVGGNESRPWLYDTIEKYGVDLVIQGHSHLVTRTYPMKDGQIVSKDSVDLIQKGDGTVYTTIGSTTLNHDSIGNPNVEECMTILTPDNNQPAYTVVSVKDDRIVMTVKQINGYVLDEFTIAADADKVANEGNGEQNNGGTNNGDQNNGGTNNGASGNNDATQKPTDNSKPTTGTAKEESDGGCGSVMGGAAVVVIAVAAVGMGFSFKGAKKED